MKVIESLQKIYEDTRARNEAKLRRQVENGSDERSTDIVFIDI